MPNPHILKSKQDKKTGKRIELNSPLTLPCGRCNLFITITYSYKFLPKNNSPCKEDLAEYLDKNHQPHFFNVLWTWITKAWQRRCKQYLSALIPLLTDIWDKGEIADITFLIVKAALILMFVLLLNLPCNRIKKSGLNYYNFTRKNQSQRQSLTSRKTTRKHARLDRGCRGSRQRK